MLNPPFAALDGGRGAAGGRRGRREEALPLHSDRLVYYVNIYIYIYIYVYIHIIYTLYIYIYRYIHIDYDSIVYSVIHTHIYMYIVIYIYNSIGAERLFRAVLRVMPSLPLPLAERQASSDKFVKEVLAD